jgi:G3E family GTPase
MTKIDIVSGFLGAGKTTLINRLIHDAYKGEKLVLIENEFGEIGIDGGFLQEAGVEIAEMNSGCICCSLVGDFSEALKKVVAEYAPDRILIEPSGVGKLSDVTKAVVAADIHDAVINSSVVVVDVNKCKMYMKNFGEFFNDQIEHAGCIFFSHTDKTTEAKLHEAVALVRAHNADAALVTTPADKLDINALIEAFEKRSTLEAQLAELAHEEICPECGHHHHGHHHHDHDDHEHHHHDEHHHDHGEDCHCHECEEHAHEHHHDHHDHDHHHEHAHHHHHADEVFTSWGRETVKKFSREAIADMLKALENSDKYGFILRAKGIVEGENGEWIHFDYVPGEPDVRNGCSATIGKICVIGSKIDENAICALFEV